MHLSSGDCDGACPFNALFHSVFTRSSFQIPLLEKLATPSSTLSDIIGIPELDMFDALSSLDSVGIDEVGPKIVKHCEFALYKPISIVSSY